MITHIDDTFMTVSEDNGIVLLCWKRETSGLTDELFKQEALKFVEVVEMEQAKKIAVDMRDFQFQLSPELIAWRNEHVIAVYNKIGTERFAFIGNTQPAVEQKDPNNTFTTRYFQIEEGVKEWFNQT